MGIREKTAKNGGKGLSLLLSRRGFFSIFSAGTAFRSLGFVALALACKTRKREDVKQNSLNSQEDDTGYDSGENTKTPETDADTDAAGSDAFGNENSESKKTCDQSKVNYIKWQDLPDVQDNLEPVYKFYGDTASSMMVISLPFYQHGNLLEVFIVRPSGKLLAGKGITDPADIRPNTTLRPVIFDNLQIKSDRLLIIIFKTACGSCSDGFLYSKHAMKFSITFADTFMGKKVLGLTPRSVPGLYAEYQAFANIGPDEEATAGFFDQGTYTMASEEAVFVGSSFLKDYAITDIVGNIISQKGEKFNNIIEYPEFVCYKLVNNQFYIRTFVRLV